MSIVNLVSGGLDSTLIGILSKEEGISFYPLFIDYGQRAAQIEWNTCKRVHEEFHLPIPTKIDLSGFGKLIVSGLTSVERDVKEDAFTPGRNLLFLVVGAAYAFQIGATAVTIGLLSEQFSLFPDQTQNFIHESNKIIETALGRPIQIVTPLKDFTKYDVVQLAKQKGISGTYSCHLGTEVPCGSCISCMETKLN